jgi:hypothetical protein
MSVEPDPSVWDALEKNLEANGCSVYVHRGFVSKTSHDLFHYGYGTQTIPATQPNNNSISVEKLQNECGFQFDTLVADCEGFLETLFDEHPFLYTQLHTILFEADNPTKCNYTKLRAEFLNHGFREIIHGFQNVYKK